MRIGLFSDTYLPVINGISFALKSQQEELEALGHEVFIFAPAPGLRYKEISHNVIRFPAIKGLFFEDYLASLFFPPQQLRKIKSYNLDIIQFHTPSQVGLLGIHVALKYDIPLFSYYHTDLYEYVTHYPAVFPGLLALTLVTPMIISSRTQELKEIFTMMKPKSSLEIWNKRVVSTMMTMIHNRCRSVVVPSIKIQKQLVSWNTQAKIKVIPTGVAQPLATPGEIQAFKTKYNITPDQQVILHLGRLGPEKNIELLLQSFQIIYRQLLNARLFIVGDAAHKANLVRMASELGISNRVTFTGFIDHDKLSAVYQSATLFAFPSVTDTQALVLSEATSAGLPVVMIDQEITKVVKDGVNGYIARNEVGDFAAKITDLLGDEATRKRMSKQSTKLAANYSPRKQALKVEKLYLDTLAQKKSTPDMTGRGKISR